MLFNVDYREERESGSSNRSTLKNKLVRTRTGMCSVNVGVETHIGGSAKHGEVEGGLLETGLGGMGP